MIKAHNRSPSFGAGSDETIAVRGTHNATDPASRLFQLEPAPSWMEQAACRGMSPEDSDRIFFGPNQWNNEAVLLCGGCPVQLDCGDYGSGEEYGIFGGITAAQRREKQSA